jgi:hypothetical protein
MPWLSWNGDGKGWLVAAKLHGFTRQRSSGHLRSSTGCGGLTEEHTSSGLEARRCWCARRDSVVFAWLWLLWFLLIDCIAGTVGFVLFAGCKIWFWVLRPRVSTVWLLLEAVMVWIWVVIYGFDCDGEWWLNWQIDGQGWWGSGREGWNDWWEMELKLWIGDLVILELIRPCGFGLVEGQTSLKWRRKGENGQGGYDHGRVRPWWR